MCYLTGPAGMRTLVDVPKTAPPSEGRTGLRPAPEPLDPPMTPFVVAGLVAFTVAGLAVLPWRDSHPEWFWTCVAGDLWGLLGLVTMRRYDRRRAARRAAE